MIKEKFNWYISIGEVAKMLGVNVITIRRWESKGIIIHDYRTVGGHKRYEYAKMRKILTTLVREGKITKELIEKMKIDTFFSWFG